MTAAPQERPDGASVLTRATLRAAERLGVGRPALARVLGASEATISRLARGGALLDPATKRGEVALLLVRLYRSLDALVGGDDAKARAWLHADNVHLRGVPAERITSIEGLVDVVQYSGRDARPPLRGAPKLCSGRCGSTPGGS